MKAFIRSPTPIKTPKMITKLNAFYHHELPAHVHQRPEVRAECPKAPPLTTSTAFFYGTNFLLTAAITYMLIKQTRFNQPKRHIKPETIQTKFADVAGSKEAKLELAEIVQFLKDPSKFNALGAKIPRGCLLVGDPGLGKTLLARAIAGEANVPFFACSASEFIEMYIGVGASRIRELFKEAKKRAPAIIFVDEIDAIGKIRAQTQHSEERDQTINQLLTELDGFDSDTQLVILAATNRPEILDPALTRPGRFDRQIHLEPPTLDDREAILKIHTTNKPLDPTLSLRDIAKITTGLSGAELANIANEAAILAARDDKTQITKQDFDKAFDRVLLGHEKQHTTQQKKRILAAHETGHTVTALKVGEFNEISKVSIIPRGKAGGITLFEEQQSIELHTRKYLENKLVVALGGRAAEELAFGTHNITTGSSNDLEYAANLARAMVTQYGFTDKLSPSAWMHTDIAFSTLNTIDKEIAEMIKEAYSRAKNILENNQELFKAIADALLTHEVLSHEDIKKIEIQFQKHEKND